MAGRISFNVAVTLYIQINKHKKKIKQNIFDVVFGEITLLLHIFKHIFVLLSFELKLKKKKQILYVKIMK